jgi:ATP-dependent exoDNAse (exonuclease V) beta subunit
MPLIAIHPRDARLTFDPEAHKYWWDGVAVSTSVTGLWESFFPSFDPDATIDKFFASWLRNPSSKYHALCSYLSLVERVDEPAQKHAIKLLWEANRTRAAALGTALHAQIESHLLTGQLPNEEMMTVELKQYVSWRADHSTWRPLRAEMRIYDDRARVAGTLDSLWRNGDGRLVLVDWKRCQPGALEKKAYRGETGFGPCAELANSAMGHYTAQQNLYAAILKRNYDIYVAAIFLVQLHPDLKTYKHVEVPMLPGVATAMLDEHERWHHECS